MKITTETGSLRFFDAAGTELRAIPLSLAPKQRLDVAIHDIGQFKTGMLSWEPDDSDARFALRENRYYYGSNGLSELVDSVSLTGRRGAAKARFAPFDSRQRTVALEISNTAVSATNVFV